jgi:hypothetical protein
VVLNALDATLVISGENMWPFDNTKIIILTQALVATMTTITAPDVNTLSATQAVVLNSGRRMLLQSTSSTITAANVLMEFNAGIPANVPAVSADLQRVVVSGSLSSEMTKLGLSNTGVYILSSKAAAMQSTSKCAQGSINGICIGSSASSTAISLGAIIAIAVVGGAVVLLIMIVILCCCMSRLRARDAAAAAAVAGPKKQKELPASTAPPVTLNYPQFASQTGLTYIPPRPAKTVSGGLPISAISTARSGAAQLPTAKSGTARV